MRKVISTVTIDGRQVPAYRAFKGRVTDKMIERYGDYQAARHALENRT